MNYAALALLFGAFQTITVVLLVADKWVHRITGGKSLEARIVDMETRIDSLHRKASDFQTLQQVQVGKFSERLAAIDEHLRNTDLNVKRIEDWRENR